MESHKRARCSKSLEPDERKEVLMDEHRTFVRDMMTLKRHQSVVSYYKGFGIKWAWSTNG